MSRSTMSSIRLPLSAALFALGLGSASCADAQESLIVTNANLLSAESPCTATTTMLASDTVDISFDTGYIANFTLLNNLQEAGAGASNSGVESSEIKVTDVIVELQDPWESGILSGALTEWSSPVASNSFNGGDSMTLFVELPAPRLAELAAQVPANGAKDVLLSVRFRAQRASNNGLSNLGVIESRSFEFPLTVCHNCLRATLRTEWTDGEGNAVELCSGFENHPTIGGGGTCGQAQSSATYPVCCGGNADAEPFGCFP